VTWYELMDALETRGCRVRCAVDDPVAKASQPLLRCGPVGWYAPPGVSLDDLREALEANRRELSLILAALATHEVTHHAAPSWGPILHKLFPDVELVEFLLTPMDDWA